MYDRDKAISFLRKHLTPWRVDHSIRVMETALSLCEHWGGNPYNVEIAALMHDCGKWIDEAGALKKLESFGIIIDGELKYDYNLVHGVLGSFLVQEELGVYEKEVIDAIRYHVTGRWDMTLIEKIVYIADKLEPARDYPKVNEMRELMYKDIDKCIVMIFEETIKYLIDTNHFIAPETIEARNYLLLEESQSDRSQ